jgi:serine beta-lactamase-like protein LACTB
MIQRLLSYTIVLILLPAPARLAAHSQAGLPPDRLKKVEAVITSEMSRLKIPAVSVALVTNNQLQWSNGYGLADLENFVPAKSSTAYRLASVSKPITAVAAMQLAERGKLDLDTPVQKYCPAFPQKQWPINTRQLLAHVSGIRHYQSTDEAFGTRHYNSLVEALEIFKNDPLLFEPGTKFSYTTFGYVLLGCVIEGASGMKYADYVRENISNPTGMADLRVDDVYALIPNRAQGYSKTEGGDLQNSAIVDNSNKIPGGGALTERNGRREIWHDGGQARVSTILYMLPIRVLLSQ